MPRVSSYKLIINLTLSPADDSTGTLFLCSLRGSIENDAPADWPTVTRDFRNSRAGPTDGPSRTTKK
jgi:hypothetical protein